MEDAGREAEHDRAEQEGTAHGDNPACARVAPAQPREDQNRQPGHHREAEQPPGLIAQRRLEQAEGAGGAAEQAVATEAAGAASRAATWSPGLPSHAAQAVVAEDQRPDAVVRG